MKITKITGPCKIQFGGESFTATDVKFEMDLAPTPEPEKVVPIFPNYFAFGCNNRGIAGQTETAFPE